MLFLAASSDAPALPAAALASLLAPLPASCINLNKQNKKGVQLMILTQLIHLNNNNIDLREKNKANSARKTRNNYNSSSYKRSSSSQ